VNLFSFQEKEYLVMHSLLRSSRAVVLATLACLAAPSAQGQATVFSQTTDKSGGFASQNDTSGGHGNYATTYDNFALASSTSIGSLTWAGDFFNGSPAEISAFTVSFYADNAGVPGSPLQTASILGKANEIADGNDLLGDPVFNYSAALPTAFAANGGTTYWMSIVANVGYPPQWLWENATGGDGRAYQTFTAGQEVLPNDMTFSLISAATVETPEPGSLALLSGMALSGFLCLKRRQKLRTAA
jgi:hypothetical protein